MDTRSKENFETLVERLERFLTTKTVVGEPIHIDDTILVPLVDVTFGMGAGSSAVSKSTEKTKEREKQGDGGFDAGGCGIGAKIAPTAMLVIQNGTTQLINIKAQDSISKIIDMVPGIVSKVPDFISKFTGDNNKDKEQKKEEVSPDENYHKMNK
jgi:uncharacterized spore protein YtfJ